MGATVVVLYVFSQEGMLIAQLTCDLKKLDDVLDNFFTLVFWGYVVYTFQGGVTLAGHF